jgi:putative transposase
LIVAGYPYHIIFRGNNRGAIFYNDKDRRFFIECLKAAKEKTRSKIYAYCLMTNHVHLLLEPSSEDRIGNLIQSLGRRYVRYINQTYRRTGTLWEGRFKSSLVSKDEYLLACARYIELNPVRAKMVNNPKDYPWSSFGLRAEGRPDELLDEDPVYKNLGKTSRERQMNYKGYSKISIPQEELSSIRNSVQKGGIFGNKGFFDKVAQLTGRAVALRSRGRPRKSL